MAAYDGGDNAKPEFKSLTNNEVNEIFDHNSANIVFDWDINDHVYAEVSDELSEFLLL